MAKTCGICGEPTIFYVWSSSGRFDRSKLPIQMRKIAIPICMRCCHDFGFLSERVVKPERYPKKEVERKYFERTPLEVNSYHHTFYIVQNDWNR